MEVTAVFVSPMVAAPVVGALLAVSGAVLQSVLRNPLAEPYMLGTTGGAALFTVVAINLGFAASPLAGSAAAFAGAMASLAAVGAVALLAGRRRGRLEESARLNAPGDTVILAGFVTSSFTCSLQMLALSRSESGTYERLSKWLFGNLSAVTPGMFAFAAAVLAAVLIVLLRQAKFLDVLQLGSDRAECLGVDTRRLTVQAIALVALATAVAVATAGAIGFVGLVAPHVARAFVGYRHRLALPVAAIAGAVLLGLAEMVAEAIFGGLPAGVVCALGGGPFMLWLLVRGRV